MDVQAKDLMALMDTWAPPSLAESWDHPGLQAGDPESRVTKVLVSLDVTKENVRWAADHGCEMIISHHPFLFRPLKEVDLSTEKGRILRTLLTCGITAFAAHTNLDSADGGVNDALADALALQNRRGLVPVKEDPLCKVAVFVPESHGEAVRKAMAEAGAGRIGAYRGCSFTVSGMGRFLPDVGAHPYIGQAGKAEETSESRIETVVPESLVPAVIAAAKKVHPYEEPAFDIYPLKNGGAFQSMGRVGELPEEMSGDEALLYVKKCLRLPALRSAGERNRPVRTVAVLGGAGAEFAPLAKKAGADLYVTGDVKYHEAQDMAAMGLLVADAGHFGTERVIIPALAKRLRKATAEKGWSVTFTEDPTAKDIFHFL